MIMLLFFNLKTAYDLRISACSSDVCSSDLPPPRSTVTSRRTSASARSTSSSPASSTYWSPQMSRPGVLTWSGSKSEERRGGKECVSTGRTRWSPYHTTQNAEQYQIKNITDHMKHNIT